jgi:hypothetical protein
MERMAQETGRSIPSGHKDIEYLISESLGILGRFRKFVQKDVSFISTFSRWLFGQTLQLVVFEGIVYKSINEAVNYLTCLIEVFVSVKTEELS